jgi:selenocysteine lyase/cysteine desulfurase
LSNALGTLVPVQEIVAMAHRAGGLATGVFPDVTGSNGT